MKRFIAVTVCFSMLVLMCGMFSSAEESSDAALKKCSVLMESSTKTVITEKNSRLAVPVGVMCKLMTVLLAAESIERGELSLEQSIKTSQYANSMHGAQIWLMPGEEMKLEELLCGIIVGNANDAAVSVAESVAGSEKSFVEMMNNRAAELGMADTVFSNCSGWLDDKKQISTAYDMALLLCELSKHDILNEYFLCRLMYLRSGETELVNSNVLVNKYKGIIGFKAGYTENSGYCVAAGANRDGTEYVSVVLGCEEKDESFATVRELLDYGFAGFQVVTPEIPDDIPDSVSIKQSTVESSELYIDEIPCAVIPNGSYSSITSRVVMPDYVYAPVESGESVGEVQFYRNDKLLYKVEIRCKKSAPKISFKMLVVILLKKVCSF